LVDANLREYLGIYVLASASSAFLTTSQYLVVSAAAASYLPMDPGTSGLITSYGLGPGIVLALLLNSILFQGILTVLVVTLALSAIVKAGRKWTYAFSAVTATICYLAMLLVLRKSYGKLLERQLVVKDSP